MSKMDSVERKGNEALLVWQKAAEQLSEQGRLAWMLGQGLGYALRDMAGDSISEEPVALRQLLSLVQAATQPMGRDGINPTIINEELKNPGIKKTESDNKQKQAPCNSNTIPVPFEKGSLTKKRYPVVFIGSEEIYGEPVSMVVGILITGEKEIIGLWPGHTTDMTVSTKLVEELWERGLVIDQGILVVCYGSLALDQAIKKRWGARAVIAHCQYKLRQEIVAHLPKEKQKRIVNKLDHVWQMNPYEAKAALLEMVEELKDQYPGASAKLAGGIDATLTVVRLGVSQPLRKYLQRAGVIRQCFTNAVMAGGSRKAGIAAVTAGLPKLRSRRLVGHASLPALVKALEKHAHDII